MIDKISTDKFVAVIDKALQRFERPGRNDLDDNKKLLEEQYLLARRVYEFVLKPDGRPDYPLFEEIMEKVEHDFVGWLVCLPFALRDQGGMVDGAIEIGTLFAEVYCPDSFLGDIGVILAEAGRREEALKRISENLERFPDDAWVIIKSGDALCVLKETEKAVELYYRAYTLTEPVSYDRDGALERLIPLLRKTGRDYEADDLVKREEKAREEKYNSYDTTSGSAAGTPVALNPIPAKSLKVGRNQPCLCGSGKKYKKCCGI